MPFSLPSYDLPYSVRYVWIAPEIYYRWVNTGRNSCPLCESMQGITLPMESWNNGIHPGFHENCDCRLEPVVFREAYMVPIIVYTPQPFLISDMFNNKFYDQVALMCTPGAIIPSATTPNHQIWIYDVLTSHLFAEKSQYNVPDITTSKDDAQAWKKVYGDW
jgi:hypothetical protein